MNGSFESLDNNQKEQAKEKHWQETVLLVGKIRDNLGKEIDPGIKETIVALAVLGIETARSCEGHIDWGTEAPYVDVESKEALDLKIRLKEAKDSEAELQRIKEEIKQKNLKEREKVMSYFSDFYKERNVPYDRRLIINSMALGLSRIESQGASLQKIRSEEIKKAKLQEYQGEMKMFTDFLKERYFSQ